MKERTDKQPLDELFARKLENMSLPPSPDGFARLQARMGQGTETPKVVFWQNPTIQRYMAVAACLLLVCLFGWFYMAKESGLATKGDVAVIHKTELEKNHQRREQPVDKPVVDVAGNQAVPEQVLPGQTNDTPVESPSNRINRVQENAVATDRQALTAVKQPNAKTDKLPLDSPALETVKPTEQVAKTEVSPVLTEPIVEKQIATSAAKPSSIAERVLVVTIAEPEALVAARRTGKAAAQEETLAETDGKADKETKAGTLWSQVKRLKQGEIFARKDEGDDERGLIGRAYSGLKHSLDKDKSIKQ